MHDSIAAGIKCTCLWVHTPPYSYMPLLVTHLLQQCSRVLCACSVEMLLDAPEIRRLPFVGERIARQAARIPQARRCIVLPMCCAAQHDKLCCTFEHSSGITLMLCLPVCCRGVKENGFDPEMFLQPLSVPKPPERFYFSFGAFACPFVHEAVKNWCPHQAAVRIQSRAQLVVRSWFEMVLVMV